MSLGAAAGVAAQLDPEALLGASPPLRAAAGFLLVLGAGAALLYRYEPFVDRATDASLEKPFQAVVYGLMAHGGVVFIGGYLLGQLARLEGIAVVAGVAALLAVSLGWLALGGLGFTVVGTGITDTAGSRQPWTGLVVGAGIAAVAAVLTPLVAGALLWLAVASAGVGGATRRWFHSDAVSERA